MTKEEEEVVEIIGIPDLEYREMTEIAVIIEIEKVTERVAEITEAIDKESKVVGENTLMIVPKAENPDEEIEATETDQPEEEEMGTEKKVVIDQESKAIKVLEETLREEMKAENMEL